MEQEATSEIDLIQSDAADEEVGDLQFEEALPTSGSPMVDPTVSAGSKSVYLNEAAVGRDGFEIKVPPVQEPWNYVLYDEPEIEEILEEFNNEDDISYLVRFTDERIDEVSE